MGLLHGEKIGDRTLLDAGTSLVSESLSQSVTTTFFIYFSLLMFIL